MTTGRGARGRSGDRPPSVPPSRGYRFTREPAGDSITTRTLRTIPSLQGIREPQASEFC